MEYLKKNGADIVITLLWILFVYAFLGRHLDILIQEVKIGTGVSCVLGVLLSLLGAIKRKVCKDSDS